LLAVLFPYVTQWYIVPAPLFIKNKVEIKYKSGITEYLDWIQDE